MPCRVFLTFDDGPHPAHTAAALDALKAEGLTATFFLIGRNIDKHGPTLLDRMVADGHRVGNHTQTHPKLPDLPADKVTAEIADGHARIEKHLRGPVKLFRPPYGAKNPAVEAAVTAAGYRLVMWDVDTVDWNADNQPEKWVANGLRGFERVKQKDRAVVLLHDLHAGTAANLRRFVGKLREAGATFGPAAEL